MKQQITFCMILALVMGTALLAQDPLHPNRTASDVAYLSGGVLTPNSTGGGTPTITRGGVLSSNRQAVSRPQDTTSPTGKDPLHPNRTTRDMEYLRNGVISSGG